MHANSESDSQAEAASDELTEEVNQPTPSVSLHPHTGRDKGWCGREFLDLY